MMPVLWGIEPQADKNTEAVRAKKRIDLLNMGQFMKNERVSMITRMHLSDLAGFGGPKEEPDSDDRSSKSHQCGQRRPGRVGDLD
jgi:hypothetical protein